MLISDHSTTLPRPFLKWAGGKSKLIAQYIPYFPKTFTTYYEPFLGGGAVFFHWQPKVAVLSDINPELVNVYCCVRDNVNDLIELLTEHQQKHNQEYYYQLRSHDPDSNLERAARFIYLNKTCFNGLYRENAKGQFNVPMGRYKNPKICNPELLTTASFLLQNAEIKVRPFQDILKLATEQDFVYFDPPYYPISKTSNFTAYSRYDFTEANQIELKQVFKALAENNVKVMLSNSDCPFIRELYQEFNIHTINAARMINSKASQRGKITELLITSY